MNRRSFCSALLALTACATTTRDTRPHDGGDASGPRTDHSPHVADVAAARDFASANNAFGFDLWRATRKPGNLAVAPASVSLALGMTWAGARGETAAQMGKVLHMADVPAMAASMGEQLAQWNDPSHGAYALSVVDRLFGEQTASFEPEFLALMKDRFAAPLEPVDFIRGFEAARGRINGWVKGETKDRIVDLLPEGSLDSDTRLVLTNAVYFKGDWLRPFEPDATYPGEFFVDGRAAKTVKRMRQVAQFAYASTDALQIVELPYQGEHLALDLVLPKQRDGLDALEQALDADGFAKLVGALRPTMVELTVPKFKLEMPSSLALKEALVELGMTLPFTGGADFTGISKTIKPLFIDDVFHKTFVAVDEKGTEAAAATAVVMRTESAMIEPEGVAFLADHPFLFVLRDTRSGAVLFIGHVADPS
jgi:serpin B